MSDARLRALERRWRETGADADEAAWLKARLQAGELTRDGLGVAAALGHAAAAQALGEPPAAPPAALMDLLSALREWPEAFVRAVVALAHAVPAEGPISVDLHQAALAAAEAWLADPTPARRQAALEAHGSALIVPSGPPPSSFQALATLAASAAFSPTPGGGATVFAIDLAAQPLGEGALGVIADALLPWALGRG